MDTFHGFLLSTTKYGDSDAILHCFTQEDGFQSYFLKGAFQSKRKAFLLPLLHLNLHLNVYSKGNLKRLSKIEPVRIPEIYSNVKQNTVLFFVSDFLNQILRNEAANISVFELILEFICQLEEKKMQSHLIFLIKMLKIQGIAPLLNEEPHLNPESGKFETSVSHPKFEAELSAVWKKNLEAEQPYLSSIPGRFRRSFLESIMIYYHYHFSEFHTPASLEIVQQIFEVD